MLADGTSASNQSSFDTEQRLRLSSADISQFGLKLAYKAHPSDLSKVLKSQRFVGSQVSQRAEGPTFDSPLTTSAPQ